MEPPRIEFPCDYPIKVVGTNASDFTAFVLQTVARHDPQFSGESVSVRQSREGNWVSVSFRIRATGEAQIRALFEELKASERVQIVL